MTYLLGDKKIKNASKILNRICPEISTGLFTLNIYWCRTAYRESWNYSAHKHSFFELHMPLEGNAEYTLDDINITLGTDTYILFSPEITHKLNYASEDFSEFVFGFDILSPQKLLSDLSKKSYFKGEASPYLYAAIDHMLKNAINAQIGFSDAISHQLACLCIEIFQQITGQVTTVEGTITNDMRIDLAIKYIDDNISSPVSCDDVADCVHISLRHLNRLTEKALFMSVARLILSRKIRFAKKLMSDPEKSLLSIAEETGFSSQQQFSKAFKRIEGITPTQYKKDLGK